jgi:NDP-sugar pyrophosphorylase family protein
MPNEVFLSYSHDADQGLIDELKKFFDARHIDAFSYKHDDQGHGDLLDARIEDAIKSSARIFFVITDGALASRWVTLEIALAEQHGKHSVAVAYHGLDLKRAPAYLTQRKAVVYTDAKSALDQLSNMDWGINVYIPAAGYGGREFSANFPKTLYPIGDRPMLFHVINALNGDRFNRIVCLNRRQYLPELTSYLVSREKFSTQVSCLVTDTEAWPQAIAEHRPVSTFLVQLSDVILWLPGDEPEAALQERWREVVIEHQRKVSEDYLGTLIISPYYRISAGKVEIEGNNAIKEVEENPMGHNPLGQMVTYINTGTALLEPSILEYVRKSDRSLLGEAIRRAMHDKKKFGAFIWGKWYHVLNPNDWHHLHEEYLRRSSQPSQEDPMPQGPVADPGGVEGGSVPSSALIRDASAAPPTPPVS